MSTSSKKKTVSKKGGVKTTSFTNIRAGVNAQIDKKFPPKGRKKSKNYKYGQVRSSK